MLHIAFIIPTLDRIGGAEQQVLSLAFGLRRRNWKISIISLSGTAGDTAERLSDSGIAFTSLKMRKGLADPLGWIQFQRWLRQNSPDIVHSHLLHATLLARLSCVTLPSITVIDTLHSSYTGSAAQQFGYKVTRKLSDQVTAVSNSVADTYRSENLIMTEKIAIIFNGIDISHYRPDRNVYMQVRAQLGIQDEFIWSASGRLEPVKNYPQMLNAIAELPSHCKLIIAGAGRVESSLRQQAKQLNIQDRVRFLGFTNNVLPWLQAADAYLLTSLWEGLPIGLLEACSCALPAVTTDVPGTREVVQHNVTGFMAPLHDSTTLQNQMRRLMEFSQQQRTEIGKLARVYVTKHFSLDSVLDCWESLYLEITRSKA